MTEIEVENPDCSPAFAFRGMAMRTGGRPESRQGAVLIQGVENSWNSSPTMVIPACPVSELRSIGMSIPGFAIWQIGNLERSFHRYCNILQLASRDVRFRRQCMLLMASAERISGGLDLVRDTGQWTIFNRAAFELRQDCEQLADLMEA